MSQHLAPQLAGDIERAAALLDKAGCPVASHRITGDLRHHAALNLRRLDAQAPPFKLPKRFTAEALAKSAEALFEKFDRSIPPSIPALATLALEQLRLSRAEPVRKAIMAAALLAEDMPNNAYHNATHIREVLSNVVMLSGVNDRKTRNNARFSAPLSAKEQARLILAAIAHDLGHDGGSNMVPNGKGGTRRVPYRLEAKSVRMLKPVMKQAGMSRADMAEVEVMILATDPGGPHKAVMQALDHHFSSKPLPARFPKRLKALKSSKRLSVMCGLMCDSDILGSAGLTLNINRLQTERLSKEWGRKMGAEDTIGFLTHVVGMRFCTAAGHVFDPNLKRIHKEAMVARGKPDLSSRGPTRS
ncbi:MAG: hypothetical protein Alpg2KO_29020 [Alphaproteobacteria bacterium]